MHWNAQSKIHFGLLMNFGKHRQEKWTRVNKIKTCTQETVYFNQRKIYKFKIMMKYLGSQEGKCVDTQNCRTSALTWQSSFTFNSKRMQEKENKKMGWSSSNQLYWPAML